MIKPTVGRVVWFCPLPGDSIRHDGSTQPLAAIITHVWGDRMVNLAVFGSDGRSAGYTSVELHQPGDERLLGRYAEWMPYQLGQAARTEAAEAKTAGGAS